jgi:hypothetical protein
MSKVAVALAACVVLSACATATRTTVDYLYVITDPAGAQVTTSLGPGCVAPCTIILPRRADFDVTITQAGYTSWSGRVTRVRKGADSPFDSAPAQAAGGAAFGAATGLVAAEAAGEVGLTLSGGLGVTSAGAGIVFTSVAAGVAVPIAVDATTGANYDFAPNPLIVRLIPMATP